MSHIVVLVIGPGEQSQKLRQVPVQIPALVENAFLQLKRWRGIATWYAKRAESFLAAVQIRCLALWLNVL
jgi:hypothetical protein